MTGRRNAWPPIPDGLGGDAACRFKGRRAARKPCCTQDGRTIMTGENVIIQPMSHTSTFIRLDDLSADLVGRVSGEAPKDQVKE